MTKIIHKILYSLLLFLKIVTLYLFGMVIVITLFSTILVMLPWFCGKETVTLLFPRKKTVDDIYSWALDHVDPDRSTEN